LSDKLVPLAAVVGAMGLLSVAMSTSAIFNVDSGLDFSPVNDIAPISHDVLTASEVESVRIAGDLRDRFGSQILTSALDPETNNLRVVVTDEAAASSAREIGVEATVRSNWLAVDTANEDAKDLVWDAGVDNFGVGPNSDYSGLVVRIGMPQPEPVLAAAQEGLDELGVPVEVEFGDRVIPNAGIPVTGFVSTAFPPR